MQAAENPSSRINRIIGIGTPVLYVETWEEERLEYMLSIASKALFSDDRPLWSWTAALGFTSGPDIDSAILDPVEALAYVINTQAEAIVLMKDLPAQFRQKPELVRALRDAYDTFSGRPGTVVLSHPSVIIPEELSKEVYLYELPGPDVQELEDTLQGLNREYAGSERVSDEWLDNTAFAMQGLLLNEARDLFRQLMGEKKRDVDAAISAINEAKAQLMMKESCVEVITKTYDIDKIGGIDTLKKWVLSRRQLLTREAQAANVQLPAGVLMMGVSGCGKSLAAKTIASAWDMPLIRLDMNKVMSGGWGTPEVAWERAIRAVEKAAPVVLWIDEIENSFGFLNDTATSGNMTIFSSFLTWMQEKPANVFVAATANRIEILPPEMLRKGRFDQLFFFDLPEAGARSDILDIHIRAKGGDPAQFDIDHLAESVVGWTAAEIEQMVNAAQVDAFADGREFNYDDLVNHVYKMVPLSKTMPEQLNALRIWSRNRAINAK